MKQQLSIYEKWYGKTVLELEKLMECTTSDAQGFLDANDFHGVNAWIKGFPAKKAAQYVIEKTRQEIATTSYKIKTK